MDPTDRHGKTLPQRKTPDAHCKLAAHADGQVGFSVKRAPPAEELEAHVHKMTRKIYKSQDTSEAAKCAWTQDAGRLHKELSRYTGTLQKEMVHQAGDLLQVADPSLEVSVC